MTINRLILIFVLGAGFLVTLRSGVLSSSSATPYVQTTQSAAIEQTAAQPPTTDVGIRRNVFAAINGSEYWRDPVFSPSDATMFGLNVGYVNALVKADSVRFNLSSLYGGMSAASHNENLGIPANGTDRFEARWYFEQFVALAQVHAMISAFSNLGAVESFNFEPFVTLAHVHETLGNFSFSSAMSISITRATCAEPWVHRSVRDCYKGRSI